MLKIYMKIRILGYWEIQSNIRKYNIIMKNIERKDIYKRDKRAKIQIKLY